MSAFTPSIFTIYYGKCLDFEFEIIVAFRGWERKRGAKTSKGDTAYEGKLRCLGKKNAGADFQRQETDYYNVSNDESCRHNNE